MNGAQKVITNIVFTASSFLTLIVGLFSIVLPQCFYCHYKDRNKIEPIKSLINFVSVIYCAMKLIDSFQWVFLLNDSASCMVLGAFKEYITISSMTIVACLGIHLLILIYRPKCFQVIAEEKQKRYNIFQRIYIITSLSVPTLFVPWPFIEKMTYGKDEYICYLHANDICNSSVFPMAYVVGYFLMIYLWAIIVWLFTVAVVLLAFHRHCVHKSVTRIKPKTTKDITMILILLILYLSVAEINSLHFVIKLIPQINPFYSSLQLVVLSHLLLIINFIIITFKQVKAISSRHKGIASINRSMTTHGKSYGTTSHTNFVLPDNEWA